MILLATIGYAILIIGVSTAGLFLILGLAYITKYAFEERFIPLIICMVSIWLMTLGLILVIFGNL